MAYTAEISRDNPTCIMFIIDQSASMTDNMAIGRSKASFVADALNRTLYTLVTNCTKSDGVRDYFDISVIGYGGRSVDAGLGGALRGGFMHPISSLAESPLRVEERTQLQDDGAGGVFERKVKFPVWFEATGNGGTPMRAALTKAAEVLVDWCDRYPNSYPPTVLHVTDGESTDGNPEETAEILRQISTLDGSALLFNLHVSTQSDRATSFPSSDSNLPDQYAQQLYRMSSQFPSHLLNAARNLGYRVSEGARGYVLDADPKDVVNFFAIGTRPAHINADR